MGPKAVRRIITGLAVISCVVAFGFLGLKYLAQKPPDFYSEIMIAEMQSDPEKIHEQAEVLVGDVIQLRNDVANEPEWSFRITEAAVNAWLIEHGLNSISSDIPPELADLRVHFGMERLLIAFKWNGRPIKSVVSLSLTVSCTANNEFEIGIESARAGTLPVPWNRFKDEIQQAITDNGIKAEWKEIDSIPKLCFQIKPALEQSQINIDKVTILDKEVRIVGRSTKQVKE